MRIRPHTVLLFGFLVGAIGVGVMILPFTAALEEEVGLGWIFQLRGERSAPAEALVVGIDGPSAFHLDDVRTINQLSRARHAELIRLLTERNAAAIVIDVFFGTSRPDQDGRLLEQIQNAERVVLLQRWNRQTLPLGDGSEASISRPESPQYYLSDAAMGVAPFMLPLQRVRLSDRVHVYANFGMASEDVATLPVSALTLHAFTSMGEDAARLIEAAFPIDEPPSNKAYGFAHTLAAREKFAALTALLGEFRERTRRSPALLDAVLSRVRVAAGDAGGSDANVARVAALLRAYAAPHNALVNFYGGSASLDRVPLFAALRADALPDDLTGRVVFIGAAEFDDWVYTDPDRLSPATEEITIAPSGPPQDRHFTVFGTMSGVEIAATAFLNLLHGDTLRRLDLRYAAALVFVIGALAGVIALLVSGVRAIIAIVALGALVLAAAYYSFANHNMWLPITTPALLQLPLALLIGLTAQFVASRRRERNVTEAMSFYVPSDVVHRAGTQGRAPSEIEERFATCMVTDIEGYTRLSETVPPLKLATSMGQYWRIVNEVVESAHHGRTIDIVADSAMCVWEAPGGTRAQGDPDSLKSRQNACLAAVDLSRAIDRFNKRKVAAAGDDGFALPTRFGLHAGWTAVGAIGGGGHYDYGVVGDVPNTASRVEGLNKILGSRVLATRSVTDNLSNIVSRPVGTFQFVNKSIPLEIHEIVSARATCEEKDVDACARFANAMAAYWRRDLAAAGKEFAALLDENPNDGPARYWLSRCHAPPPPEGEDFIRLDIK